MLASSTYDEGMKLTTTVRVWPGEPQALLHMVTGFNQACNWLSDMAFREKLFHWLPLQRRAYHELRQRFGLTAAQATVAVRKVAYVYRNKARRSTLARFQPLGAIPLFQHKYRDGGVRLYGLEMPCQARPGVDLPRLPAQATLSYLGEKFVIHQSVEAPTPELYQPTGFLGCDLGITNILVDSDGQIYSGGQVNGLRHRHARLRARLQTRGSRSAKRLLRHRRRKEGRFGRDVNHRIAKRVVAKAKTRTLGIALEDLKGIRERVKVRKAHRRQHSSWSFDQLRQFIEYKSKLAGVSLSLVDPRNTSRTCPRCSAVDKGNRRSQSLFQCVACGFGGHADHVAALNIRRRAGGDQPDAASVQDSCESLHDPLVVVKG